MDMSYTSFDGRAESTFTVICDFPRLERISVCEHGRKRLMANVEVLRSKPNREPLPQVLDLNRDDDCAVQICRHGFERQLAAARPLCGTGIRIHSQLFSHFLESGCHKPKALPSIIDSALMYCNTVRVPHPRDAFVFVARVWEHDANPMGWINNQAQTYLLGHCAHFNRRTGSYARFE